MNTRNCPVRPACIIDMLAMPGAEDLEFEPGRAGNFYRSGGAILTFRQIMSDCNSTPSGEEKNGANVK